MGCAKDRLEFYSEQPSCATSTASIALAERNTILALWAPNRINDFAYRFSPPLPYRWAGRIISIAMAIEIRCDTAAASDADENLDRRLNAGRRWYARTFTGFTR